jgi:prepilin-type N-terminal cleavage/methylation domain-containing protein
MHHRFFSQIAFPIPSTEFHSQSQNKNKRSGFTLIELLIVVAIIGILSAIAVPNFLNAQSRAKISRVKAALKSVGTAIELYRLDNNDILIDGQLYGQLGLWYDGLTVLQPLTTPINYISAGAFYDPFRPIPSALNNAAYQAVEARVFHYRNLDWMRKTNNQGAATNAFPGSAWLVRSPGPDRWYIVDPQKLLNWYAYDSSNGLTSVGDVINTNLGFLGDNFQGSPQ